MRGQTRDWVDLSSAESCYADRVGVLFILAAIVFIAIVFFSMLDDRAMPFACPACQYDGQIGPPTIPWYSARGSSVQCRSCGARFREHADGSLAKDQ